jgi:phosphotransferase system enzyme I (PtsI)
MLLLEGIPISPGCASGTAVVYDYDVGRRLEVPSRELTSPEVEAEWGRLDNALERSRQDLQLLEQTASKRPNLSKSVALLSAHSAMTREIAALVKQHVGRELVNVEEALDSVICDWVERLQRLDSEYLRQREQDVRDVGRRMTRYLAGSLPWSQGPLPAGSIVVAQELLPSEAIELVNCGVAAIVSEHGGKYSHTAILARSLGIPAVTSILHATSQIRPGMQLLVDGQAGTVTIAPSNSDKNSFMQRMEDYQRLVTSTADTEKLPCTTQDKIEISLLANLGLPDEIDAVEKHGLVGVGLFRTEFLFLESHERPDLQSQQEVYGNMAKGLDGRPLVIRTFDLGGDKRPPFLVTDDAKAYRSLHLRGLRFSLSERDLLDTQLHAILHVAQTSDVRILFPMVIGTDDLKQAIARLDRIVEEHGFLRTPPIGAMIETPAALFALDELLDLVDFMALGTNDLTQYILATDRDLAEAADDCSALHPAVLRAIKQVIGAAEKHQCPVCVCGEEAGDADFACLLVGLGIRELSLSLDREAVVREALRGINATVAAKAASQMLRCHSLREVRELLAELRSAAAV